MSRARIKLAMGLAALTFSACSSTLVDYEAESYVVRRGDTLYTIAFRYGVDYRSLAAWNNLRNPDLIYAGQRLRLRPPSRAATPASSTAATPARSAPTRTAPTAPPRAVPNEPPPAWQWPTRGPILSAYGNSHSLSTGVGIGGKPGQPISAAAAGRVVYAGSGLIGYGQLVIIKHNETYLSAYGHNSRLLVSQGDQVRQGQKIAEMGLGPERQPLLHFEIRQNGRPVDPMPFLRSAG